MTEAYLDDGPRRVPDADPHLSGPRAGLCRAPRHRKRDRSGDYDHLARFGEWTMQDSSVTIPVGRDMVDAATLAQNRASEPFASTWLSANAGSGKTKVLTDRVARLLLNGVAPQHILCLTYTKAAASEMQNRLFGLLGKWAMLPDDSLRAELAKIGEDGGAAEQLANARRLFARAIEAPGGLKIQTIHSFCASLLRRFPLEAHLSPAFTEMDARAARTLRADVLEELAERSDVVARLAQVFTGAEIDAAAGRDLRQCRAVRRPGTRRRNVRPARGDDRSALAGRCVPRRRGRPGGAGLALSGCGRHE